MQNHSEFVNELRANEKPTTRQSRLVALFDACNRTDEESHYLDALLTAEIAKKSAREASEVATRRATKVGGRRRRAQTRTLVELGGLVLNAGLVDDDRATVFGALLTIRSADQLTRASWRAEGRKELARRVEEKNSKKTGGA